MSVLQNELARLREENARLKELLRKHGIAYEASTSPIVLTKKPMLQLSLEEKVALFRSLFRGREDVFATGEKLFEKARKTGYANDPDDLGGATMVGVTIAA